jgi:hypothetical protein
MRTNVWDDSPCPRVGATNVVWKVNVKIAQSNVNANHKSPLGAS